MNVRERIAEAITPTIEASQAFLEDVMLVRAGKKSLLTVIVDGETGLNLDQVTEISRNVSEIVEALPEMGSTPFTLEVTSPGIDRPLTVPRHWRKNKGRLIKVTMLDGSVIEGRIGESTEIDVQVGETTAIFAEIKKAIVQIEFNAKDEK
jgi:ribosome maturation factor RimP